MYTTSVAPNQEYYPREYSTGASSETPTASRPANAPGARQSWVDQSKNVVTTALPFLALYKPLSFSLALTMGGLRTVGSVTNFVVAIQTGTIQEISWTLLETVVSVISLVATLLIHPIGMLIIVSHDLVNAMKQIVESAKAGEYKKILESLMSLVNNALYLALMLEGSIALTITSLASQMLVSVYQAQTEFKKENFIAAVGHLLIAFMPDARKKPKTLNV